MVRSKSENPPDIVAWDVADRVARQLLLRSKPLDATTFAAVSADVDELTPLAEQLVSNATGLTSMAGPTRIRVVDRADWVTANVASFRRLLVPLASRLAETPSFSKALAPASRAVSGAEVGALLAWMSGRVLGQYDLLGPVGPQVVDSAGGAAGGSVGDIVYFVGSNIVELERRHGFAPREFRLWIALHEVTHRMQFTGVPWLREHFLGLVERGTSMATPDAKVVLDALRRAVTELREGRNPLADGGVVGLIASSEQLATLREAQALMSLLEGHGDVVMGLAGADRIPGAARFAETLRRRRESASGVSRAILQVTGMEAKMRQYSQGETFVERVRAIGGDELFSAVWTAPEMLPSHDEIQFPDAWIARVGGAAPARA